MRKPAAIRLARTLLAMALALPFLLAPAVAHAAGYDSRTAIVNTAIAQLGKPYKWGSAGPTAFDCSGLVVYCYAADGIRVPRTVIPNIGRSGMIWADCDHVATSALEPGDLVFRADPLPPGSTEPTPGAIYHVGIYVGGGRVIHAPGTGQTVSYQSVSKFPWHGRLKAQYWPNGDRTYDQPVLERGDFTGDGREDLVSFLGLGGTSTRAYVMPSSSTTFGAGQIWFGSSYWDWQKTKVVSGDFNADGKADLACLYDYGADQVKLWAFLSDGTKFRTYTWWATDPGRWSWARTRLVAADFDGDKRCDVGLLYDYGASTTKLFVARSTGSSFSPPAQWWSGGTGLWNAQATKLAAGDFTGDGKADVALMNDYGRGAAKVWIAKSTGTAFSLLPSAWYSAGPGGWYVDRAKMVAGDITGDRRADLLMLYDYGGSTAKLWSFISSGSGFSTRTYWFSGSGGWDWERAKLAVGDFDHEGRADAMMLYDYFGSRTKAWTFESRTDGVSSGAALGWDSGAGGMEWNRIK